MGIGNEIGPSWGPVPFLEVLQSSQVPDAAVHTQQCVPHQTVNLQLLVQLEEHDT